MLSITRRRFLSTAAASGAVVSLSRCVPNHLLAAEGKAAGGENVLVVVQLTGGNDGLNTVVPYADDAYARNRFATRIGENQVLKIDDYAGLHPSMQGFSELLEAGKLAIVQGVGYPNPNRSHFESMDLWHTAHRAVGGRELGWLGRYLDGRKSSGGDAPALHFGGEKQPLALAAEQTVVPSVASLERFRLDAGGHQSTRSAIETITGTPRGTDNGLLDFVQRSTASALVTSRRVEESLGRYKTDIDYPTTGLAQKLRTVAQLIDAGLSTRIYYMQLDGFDTHSNQAPAHSSLLSELSGAVAAFINDVAAHGHGDRVLLTTFSEFGRRVKENASRGTDHGAAAPMFLAGGSIKPGLIGRHPSLEKLDDGDLIHHTDYRQVYASLLDHWLRYDSRQVLGRAFKPVDVLASA